MPFDLIDFLRLLEPELDETEWAVSGLECTGETAPRLEAIEQHGERIAGPDLLRVASKLRQVIDGKFVCYRGGPSPWVTILAWDSTGFDFVTDDETVIARVRAR